LLGRLSKVGLALFSAGLALLSIGLELAPALFKLFAGLDTLALLSLEGTILLIPPLAWSTPTASSKF
jgi:hypothetical protein